MIDAGRVHRAVGGHRGPGPHRGERLECPAERAGVAVDRVDLPVGGAHVDGRVRADGRGRPDFARRAEPPDQRRGDGRGGRRGTPPRAARRGGTWARRGRVVTDAADDQRVGRPAAERMERTRRTDRAATRRARGPRVLDQALFRWPTCSRAGFSAAPSSTCRAACSSSGPRRVGGARSRSLRRAGAW